MSMYRSDGKLLLQLMEIVGAAELPKPGRGNMRVCQTSPAVVFITLFVDPQGRERRQGPQVHQLARAARRHWAGRLCCSVM